MKDSIVSKATSSNLSPVFMTFFLAVIFCVAINFVGYALIDWLKAITPSANFIQGFGASIFRAVAGACVIAVPVFFWVFIIRAFPHWFDSN